MPLVVKRGEELDLVGLAENIQSFEEHGFEGFIALGCMGEFYAVNDNDFYKIVDTAVNSTNKIVSVFGTTAQTTRECIKRTKYVEEAGGDGVMIGPPSIIPCTPEEVFEHYKAVNDTVDDVQIMVYNNPSTFRFNITSELWDRLMQLDRIKAIKESNGDVEHRTLTISHISNKINVFSGGEIWLLGDSLAGAKGVVSTCGLGAPKASLEFFKACIQRNLNKAIPLHIKFAEIFKDVTAENEVAWLKASAEIGGFKVGAPRLPYLPLNQEMVKRLKQGMREIESMV